MGMQDQELQAECSRCWQGFELSRSDDVDDTTIPSRTISLLPTILFRQPGQGLD